MKFYSIIDESVRWLAVKGKTDESVKILEHVAKVNGNQLNTNVVLSFEVRDFDNTYSTFRVNV